MVGKDVVYHGEGIYRRDNQGKGIIREYISDNEYFRRARVLILIHTLMTLLGVWLIRIAIITSGVRKIKSSAYNYGI